MAERRLICGHARLDVFSGGIFGGLGNGRMCRMGSGTGERSFLRRLVLSLGVSLGVIRDMLRQPYLLGSFVLPCYGSS